MIAGLNPNSGDWNAVKSFLESEYTATRQELERHGISQERTEFLRGRLDAYRNLISSAEHVGTGPDIAPVNYG